MSYEDKRLNCPDCNISFVFSAEAQGLSDELGHGAPIRCRSCRQSLDNRRRYAYGSDYHLFGLSPMTALAPGRGLRN
jgi:hypothetical protein